MDNQHRQMTGYRDLKQHEVDLINHIAENGKLLRELCDIVGSEIASSRNVARTMQPAAESEFEHRRMNEAEPERWLAIAKTHFQEGLMALTRAVAQPSKF